MSFGVAGDARLDNRVMAWEWVAPVATATASITVGVAGIFFTWLSGKQGGDHAETISGQQLAHERLLASEARDQQRLETAYVNLLEMSEAAGQWVQLVMPVVDTDPPQPDPPLPTLEVQAHTEAVVRAFGSPQVRERMDSWESVVRKAISTVTVGHMMASLPSEATQARLTLERDLRPQERSARQALAEQVSAELRPGGRGRG
jgi:hypothetical protein